MKHENVKIVDEFIKAHSIYFAPNTLGTYYGCILRAFSLLPEDIELNEIKRKHIVSLALKLGKQFKSKTVQLYIDSLKSFFSYCVEEEYILKNPAFGIERPSNDLEIPYVLCDESIFKFREITKHSLRDRAIIEVLLTSGIRVQELCDLRKDSFLVATNKMHIIGKGAKDRLVLITDECNERLNLYSKTRTDDDNHLFVSLRNRGFATRSINWLIHDYALRAGLSEFISPHTFRRTFATYLYQKGMDLEYIRKLMGHENLNTTLLYTQIENIKYIIEGEYYGFVESVAQFAPDFQKGCLLMKFKVAFSVFAT